MLIDIPSHECHLTYRTSTRSFDGVHRPAISRKRKKERERKKERKKERERERERERR